MFDICGLMQSQLIWGLLERSLKHFRNVLLVNVASMVCKLLQKLCQKVDISVSAVPKGVKPFKDHKPTAVALTLCSHHFPISRVRELFKISKTSRKSFLAERFY